LGRSWSLQALEPGGMDAAGEVAAFYEQSPVRPPPVSEGPLLVVQADGKGGPMVPPSAGTPPVRLGQGQTRTTKQEAVVTGLDTIAPYVRTPQDGVAALLQAPHLPETVCRPVPVGKARRATLDGKELAMTRLVPRVVRRDGPAIAEHVALTDGAEALQQQVVSHVPAHTLGLAIIHATE
jgi:hypothetical protein